MWVFQMVSIAVANKTHHPVFLTKADLKGKEKAYLIEGKPVELASRRKRAWLIRVAPISCPKHCCRAGPTTATSVSKLEPTSAR